MVELKKPNIKLPQIKLPSILTDGPGGVKNPKQYLLIMALANVVAYLTMAVVVIVVAVMVGASTASSTTNLREYIIIPISVGCVLGLIIVNVMSLTWSCAKLQKGSKITVSTTMGMGMVVPAIVFVVCGSIGFTITTEYALLKMKSVDKATDIPQFAADYTGFYVTNYKILTNTLGRADISCGDKCTKQMLVAPLVDNEFDEGSTQVQVVVASDWYGDLTDGDGNFEASKYLGDNEKYAKTALSNLQGLKYKWSGEVVILKNKSFADRTTGTILTIVASVMLVLMLVEVVAIFYFYFTYDKNNKQLSVAPTN